MKSSFSVIISFIAVALTGCILIPLLPVKLFPSRQMPAITISYSLQGCAPRVLEQEVTSKLEGALARISGVTRIDSESRNATGWINMEFDKHTDIDAARFEVSATVRQLWPDMPEGLSYPQISTRNTNDESTSPFITYTVISSWTPIAIQQYLEDHIKPILADIAGIDKVEIHGASPMKWHLEYDFDHLSQYGLTPDDLRQAIIHHYATESIGDISTDSLTLSAVITLPGNINKFDISTITVHGKGQNSIPLQRLVKVSHVQDSPTGYFRINGKNSIYLTVTADESANQLELSERVRHAIQTLEPSLPDGMHFILNHDITDSIRHELEKIYLRTGSTIVILLLFIALTTLNLRYTLLILTSLTLNIGVAALFWWLNAIELQLYSLAGITISLNLIIDNIIVMGDSYRRTHSFKTFTAILAATLTTVGALSIVFFLDANIRLNLSDFVTIVIINLMVSLAVALFLVPALIDKMHIRQHTKRFSRRRYRMQLVLWRLYAAVSRFTVRFRWIMLLLVIAVIGGSGWLFFKNVSDGRYYDSNQIRTTLHINASLPNGSTLDQMNELIKKMEAFLSTSDKISKFQTNIRDARHASIDVSFIQSAEKSGYPYQLKSDIIAKALTLGGGSWSVYGLEDNGFSNDVKEMAGNYRVKLKGYNYDQLYKYASDMADTLMLNPRIKEVSISHAFSFWKEDYSELYIDIDKEKLAQHNISAIEFFNLISAVFCRDRYCASIMNGNFSERIVLSSSQSHDYDVWSLINIPISYNDRQLKISDFASVKKRLSPKSIAKENQSYRLCLQYEYIGTPKQGYKYLDKTIEQFQKILPMGFSAEQDERNYNWNTNDRSNYILLALVAAIIFVITAILFNSIRQPLVIISMIPISFIGTFLTFYLFELKLDQGGFASFVLLSGITVNAAIYIINEYNIRRKHYPAKTPQAVYLQSVRIKSGPIMLTILSTILGFLPFIVNTTKEGFWFPLAVGTIGGLGFSLIAIFIYMPVFMMRPRTRCKKAGL